MTLKVEVNQGKLHSATFGGHKHTGSGDIIVLVCHVTLQDHVINALFGYIVWSPLR